MPKIQDFTVGDFDNDGQDELVAALVIKEGRVAVISDSKSTIIAYELTSPQKPGAQEWLRNGEFRMTIDELIRPENGIFRFVNCLLKVEESR